MAGDLSVQSSAQPIVASGPPVGPEPLLVGEGLTRRFALPRLSPFGRRGVRDALVDVDISLPERGSIGMVGESGSGKTTLVRLLLALDKADEGTVTFRGRPVTKGPPGSLRWFRSDVQVVLQDPASSLDPRMTIGASIREPLVCLDVPGDHRERTAEVLHAVGIDPSWVTRYPHELSGGQQQRVAIARALAPRPKLLVGDEPVSGLDVSVRVQVLDLLASLADQFDLAMLLVSHDLGVVRYLCDDVLVLQHGHVVEHGPTLSVFDAPEHPYTRELISAVPRF